MPCCTGTKPWSCYTLTVTTRHRKTVLQYGSIPLEFVVCAGVGGGGRYSVKCITCNCIVFLQLERRCREVDQTLKLFSLFFIERCEEQLKVCRLSALSKFRFLKMLFHLVFTIMRTQRRALTVLSFF